ncbi:acyl-ACP--UDP-N-acetylglucosamine O-acyltransferase [Pontibacter sp. G13]|uniref:acyl-ACP--UDP-N-acetylglucosamine O-acyltransferase n=1 Tax=Pontibacter sp. G13 TaxID=3074898 RepID=UPI00288ABF44|nr:acyl-ACP--UDP-N-acetylglucosamine O-acyltransferase [Pontibacter sp. G13]WNJ21546.1 acyl-ACP--UDP-N-acetylglucosamine O-acyltransferase [Pontibacter sp. G13]
MGAEVRIGDNVHIESSSNIHGGIVIESGSWIGSNVTIHDGARIGKNCKIFPGAVISAIPQDLKFNGEKTILEIGENTTVREFATLNRGTEYHGKTVIGKNCLIMAYVHVAHDCVIGDHVVLVNSCNMGGHVEIGDHVVVGGVCAIHQFTKIGHHAMISGGSVVRKDVPPFVKAGRDPLQYEGVNSIGLRRRGFSNDKIAEIQDIYRRIFVSGMNTGRALDFVEANLPPTEERDEIVAFIRKATRGIIKGHTSLPAPKLEKNASEN